MDNSDSQFLIFSENSLLSNALTRYFNYCGNNSVNYSALRNSFNLEIKYSEDLIKDDIAAQIFQDKIATFYPQHLISGSKNELSQPFQIFNDIQISTIKESLEKIKTLTDKYSNFYRIIKKKFVEYEVVFNKIKLKSDDKKILYLFNIQSGTKRYWDTILENIFTKGIFPNQFFIFYWYSGNENLDKNTFEAEDIIWGYSRFIRDFLKARHIAFEVEITGDNQLKEEINKIKYSFKSSSGLKINKDELDDLIKRIKGSLENIYNDKFPKDYIFSEDWPPQLSKYYMYNKNKHCDKLEDIQTKIFGINLTSKISSHGILHEKDDMLSKYEKVKEEKASKKNGGKVEKETYYSQLGSMEFWDLFRKNISPLIRSFIFFNSYSNKNQHSPKFLFIDDNPDSLFQNKLKLLNKWFDKSKIYFTKGFDCNYHLINNNQSFIDKDLEVVLLNNGKSITGSIKGLKPDIIVIDLDYNDKLLGFDLLRKIKTEIRKIDKHLIHLIVLSRFEDPFIIRKSINNGALLYITKANFLRIIYKIFQLKINYAGEEIKYHNYENWHLLNKLEPSKIGELKTSFVEGKEYDFENKKWIGNSTNPKYKYTTDYQWIKKLPKADLHCHIGSCMGPDLLPETAFLVLCEKYSRNKLSDNTIKEIIKFLLPIASDPFLHEKNNPIRNDYSISKETKNYKNTFIHSRKNNESIFNIISNSDYYPLKENLITPEFALLSPLDTTLERLVSSQKIKKGKYFENKFDLRANKEVSYDDVMLFFVLLIYIRGGHDINFNLLIKELINFIKEINEIDSFNKIELAKFCEAFNKGLNSFPASLSILLNIKDNKGINLLQFLQSAHSSERCLGKDNASLFNYLRGCEYAGSAHLQTKLSIYRTTKYIVEDYALKDNIRYLDLRCAVDGYSKFGLQSVEESIEALLKGFDHYTHFNGNKIHVNIVLSAKRHKPMKEFESNVYLALKYRNGLELSKNSGKKNSSHEKDISYFSSKTKVVSFDLSGLEKGNRPSKFYQQFLPLLRACFPITIHAGEEDDYESIWEAIYLVQSQRIGHGLTLRQNEDLLNIVRERHVTIELCPISNLLTQNQPKFRPVNNKLTKDEVKELDTYPLRQYLDDNIDVTINTDNPFVNDAALTQDYLVGARLINGLTKWEILRIIKNGFKGAAIPKQEKRKLMDEIDDEIYEILLNED